MPPEKLIAEMQKYHEEYSIDPASLGMPPDFPQDLRNAVTFEAVSRNKTQLTVTEYDWPAGQMREMSREGMEQCLDKMAAILARN